MYRLFMRKTCPYSKDVIEYAHEKSIPLTLCDIQDEKFKEELIKRGGEEKTPYLIDTDHDVSMYESKLIKAYLNEHKDSQ